MTLFCGQPNLDFHREISFIIFVKNKPSSQPEFIYTDDLHQGYTDKSFTEYYFFKAN